MDNSSPVINFIKKNEAAFFIALALTFSWFFWIPLYFGRLNSSALNFCLDNVGILGPLFAALELLLITQGWGGIKSLAKSAVKWRTGIEWYIVALFLPPAIEVLVLFSMALSGTNATINKAFIANGSVFMGQVYFAIVTVVALFGYLLPRLLKSYSPLVSSLMIAAFFIVWHAPSVIANINSGQADYEFWWALGNVGMFFIFTWLCHNTRGSLVPLILFNLGLNYFRWFAKGVMQVTPVHDLYGLDFSLHLLAGIIILLASWRYFMGKAPAGIKAPGATPDS